MRRFVSSILLLLIWGCSDDPAEPPNDRDDIPPARVSDLAAIDTTPHTVTLVWTAPGDDGAAGTASEYDVRYATFPLTAALWHLAATTGTEPSPREAGSNDTCRVVGLRPDTDYTIALRSADEASNWSPVSNVVTVHTKAFTSRWRQVPLDLTPGDSRAVAVDFTGSHGMAMVVVTASGGASVVAHDFFRLQAGGIWAPDHPDDIRSGVMMLDLNVGTTGRTVLAGVQMSSPHSVVLDLRGPTPEYIEQNSLGMLTVDGEDAFMVAGGRSRSGGGGGLWTSTSPGAWSFDDLPLTGINDSGFEDVYVRGNRAVACGYDDGADTLQVILSRTDASEWEHIRTAGSFFQTFECIALGDDGTIYVGGIEGAGSLTAVAFVVQRSPAGDWTELILPDPGRLHGVSDILIADDGSLYLACWGEGEDTEANVVRAGPDGVVEDIIPFPGGLIQIGQSSAGDIYAVGFRRDPSTGAETGVMLMKPSP